MEIRWQSQINRKGRGQKQAHQLDLNHKLPRNKIVVLPAPSKMFLISTNVSEWRREWQLSKVLKNK